MCYINYLYLLFNLALFLSEGSCQKMFEERTKVDLKYESVKELIEANHSLNDLIKETGEKLSRLQSSRDELQEMAGKIKLQADQALQ